MGSQQSHESQELEQSLLTFAFLKFLLKMFHNFTTSNIWDEINSYLRTEGTIEYSGRITPRLVLHMPRLTQKQFNTLKPIIKMEFNRLISDPNYYEKWRGDIEGAENTYDTYDKVLLSLLSKPISDSDLQFMNNAITQLNDLVNASVAFDRDKYIYERNPDQVKKFQNVLNISFQPGTNKRDILYRVEPNFVILKDLQSLVKHISHKQNALATTHWSYEFKSRKSSTKTGKPSRKSATKTRKPSSKSTTKTRKPLRKSVTKTRKPSRKSVTKTCKPSRKSL